MRLLLVEDDPQLGDGLMVGMRQAGYAVDWLKDGASANLALQTEAFDLLVLDLSLPKMLGMDVLRTLRAKGQSLPVLILTARDDTQAKIDGLDAGADDYLVKPIDLDELAARARALLRRSSGSAQPQIYVDGLTVDPARRQAMVDGCLLSLSAREFSLLLTLAERAGRVMTRSQLEASLYGWQDEPDSNAIQVHIHILRKKLGAERIKTLRGVGYMLVKT